ncbi:MAG: PAS domain S-box protein [Cystobacter sp.]
MSFVVPFSSSEHPMSLSQSDELRILRAEVERLRGLLHREGAASIDAQEASYRRIVESAIDFAVIALDGEGRITHWNEGARRILGWTQEEIRGEHFAVIFTQEDRASDMPAREMRTALEQGRALDERWHQRRDGRRFWASGELMPLRDEQGASIGLVKVLRDQTSQKRLEQERERFTLLAEQSPDFVGLADAQGRGLFLNEAGRRLVGSPDGDPGDISILDMFPPEERGFVEDVIIPAQRAQGHWRGRVHFLHQTTGARIPMDYNAFVLRDEAGVITGYATISRDISALERVESALRQSDERLQFALKSSGSMGVWDWDMRGNKLYMDERCSWLYSVPMEQAAAGAPLEVYLPGLHPDDLQRVTQWIQHCIETGEEYESEYRVRPGGQERWVQARGRAYRDEQGRPTRFPGIILDITQRKHAELRQRALLDLSDRLRDLSDAGEIAAEGSRLLGQTLGLLRAGFVRVDPDAGALTLERDWSNGQAPSEGLDTRDSLFSAAIERLGRGVPIIEADIEQVAWLSDAERPAYAGLGLRGFVCLPFMRHERLAGIVYAHSTTPRAWSEADVGFIREVFSRTWEAIERAQAEQRLRESEQDLRLLTEHAPELIGYVDRELVYRFVNRAYSEWFARPLEQVIGVPARELLGEGPFSLREPYFRRALAGEVVRFEAPLDTPGLPRRELDLRFFPRRDLSGQVQGVYLFILDITERKATERLLREANELLEQRVAERTRERDRIWNLSDELMGVVSLEGYLKSANPAWTRVLGREGQMLLGRPFLELIHPDDQAAVMEAVASLARGQRVHGLEVRLRRADGIYLSLSWNAIPDDNGSFYAIGRDVTDEREAAALQKRLFDVLDQSPDFIGISDIQGQVLYLNASGRRMMGIAPGELGARSVLEYFVPEDRPLIEGTALPTVMREGKWVGRSRFRHVKTGASLPVEYNVFATRDARGRVIGLGMVSRDITPELQHEQALRETEEKLRQSQKMEAVGQLTGGIAHDFNNLLGGIIGAMEMLRRRIEAGRYAETEKYITATVNSAHRAAALTARLLAFGRRQSLDVKPTDINMLITSLVELLRRTLGESVSLKTLLPADLWPARTDANQFENALLNLAINARDAMPQGGKLTVETHNTRLDEAYARGFEGLRAGEYVVMCVSDTGHGMPPEVIARAFEPFFTTKPIGQGTGLGLSMIYGYMRQTGGAIVLDSEEGRGTVIALSFRRAGEVADFEDSVPLSDAPGTKRRDSVLVVEDDETVRALAVELLRDMGFQVMQASTGNEAMALLSGALQFDLLVSDVGLPGPNGRQVADYAREKLPSIRVILMTGYAEQAAMNPRFLSPGMELLVKPFDAQALVSKVQALVGHASA